MNKEQAIYKILVTLDHHRGEEFGYMYGLRKLCKTKWTKKKVYQILRKEKNLWEHIQGDFAHGVQMSLLHVLGLLR
jgi:hypothetical protein